MRMTGFEIRVLVLMDMNDLVNLMRHAVLSRSLLLHGVDSMCAHG